MVASDASYPTSTCPNCGTPLTPLHNNEGWMCPTGDFYLHQDGTPWMKNDSSPTTVKATEPSEFKNCADWETG